MSKKRRIRKKTRLELADPDLTRRSDRQCAVRNSARAVTERLPKKRQEFIRNIAGHEWVRQFPSDADEAAFEKEGRRWDRLRRQFLREAANPLELHLFASNWNCDGGSQPIHQIVANPHCDAGTALWLYWENDPYFYQAYRYIQDAEGWEQQWLRILRSIERRFRRNDFATSQIPFDPEPWITDRYADAEWVVHEIPEVLHHPIVARKRRKRA